jgi:orotate phosphoribosyltransferase
MQTLIEELYDLGVFKFGAFTLKSGIVSPFYLDLRLTVSSPKLLVKIADAIQEAISPSDTLSEKIVAIPSKCSFDLVCGVPYTGIPFATAFSIRQEIPMVLKRKEKKQHGTGKMCEGLFREGQKCLVIEDVITSGQSILETIAALESEKLIVQDIVVLVDREQGGRQLLERQGYRLHSILTIRQIEASLSKTGKIDAAAASAIRESFQT